MAVGVQVFNFWITGKTQMCEAATLLMTCFITLYATFRYSSTTHCIAAFAAMHQMLP